MAKEKPKEEKKHTTKKRSMGNVEKFSLDKPKSGSTKKSSKHSSPEKSKTSTSSSPESNGNSGSSSESSSGSSGTKSSEGTSE